MKLFCVIGKLKNKYSIVNHYVAKSKAEATEYFLEDYKHLDFFDISTSALENVGGFKVSLNLSDIDNFNTVLNSVHNIKCCFCTFSLTVYSGQEKVVCSHCGTINDVNFQLTFSN